MTHQEWLEKLMLNLKKKRLVGREGFFLFFFWFFFARFGGACDLCWVKRGWVGSFGMSNGWKRSSEDQHAEAQGR